MGGYYIAAGSTTAGPFTLDQLKTKGTHGGTPVWRPGLQQWRYARDVPELQTVIGPPAALSPGFARTEGGRLVRLAGTAVVLLMSAGGFLAAWRTVLPPAAPTPGHASSFAHTTPPAIPAAATAATAAHSSPASDRMLKLPILTIDGDGKDERGLVVNAEVRFGRDADREAPLLVSVEEDTLGGAGPGIRASAWLAAATAGLARADDLGGVRLSLRLPGRVDGPSAGLPLCLAVLSALDGRDLPPDLAASGTILPGGAVGPVGGLRRKLAAAAARGAKRVLVPDLIRFEPDPSAGEDVDLRALAESLHLQLLPVRDVGQAYRLAHHLPADPPAAIREDVLALPPQLERLLERRYRAALADADRLWAGMTDEQRQKSTTDPVLGPMLAQRARAGRAYRAGRLYYAAEQAASVLAATRAAARFTPPPLAAPGDTPDAVLARAEGELTGVLDGIPDPWTLLRRCAAAPGATPVGSQFCASGVLEPPAGLAELDAMRTGTLALMAGRQDPGERLGLAAVLGVYERIGAQTLRETVDALPAEAAEASALLPAARPGPRSAAVERLLHGACAAAGSAFDAGAAELVVEAARSTPGIDPEGVRAAMAENDPGLVGRLTLPLVADQLHAALSSGGGERGGGTTTAAAPGPAQPFLCAAAAQAHALALARLAAVNVRWLQLGCGPDGQGGLVYGRPELLGPMTDAARTAALADIAACRRAGVPCVAPVRYVEEADCLRGDREGDPVEVLAAYYAASLQARTLLMLFR